MNDTGERTQDPEGRKLAQSNSKSEDTHTVGSHSDDRGGEADYPCNCEQRLKRNKEIPVTPIEKLYDALSKPSQDTVSMEDIMHATPKGREAVQKAINESIEVQNKVTKKAQNTLKESNNLNTSEEHIKDTSLDDYFEDGFCGMCGTTTKDANRCHNCGIEIPSVVLSKTEVLQLFKQQQIKLIERIEGEVIGADRVTKDNVTKYARNKPEAGLINIYQDSLRRAQRQALKKIKERL